MGDFIMSKNATNQTLDLVPLSKFNDFFDYPTVGSLRQLNFYNTDGFADKVIRKIGKRLYIKISAFKEWVEFQNKVVA